jgi:hypothetical protein
MMSTRSYKVIMDKIIIQDNGEAPGKGEITWSLTVDGKIISELSAPGRKTGDGETFLLGESTTVTKSDTASLVVLGNVTELDGGLKGGDDTASFRRTHTLSDGFGVGNNSVSLSDGKHLQATVYYTIQAA